MRPLICEMSDILYSYARKVSEPFFINICFSCQGMHPAFIGAQYPFSVATGPHPPMAATAVTFPGVPVPSMTQIAVHPYHAAEAALPLTTTVAGEEREIQINITHKASFKCVNVNESQNIKCPR